MAAVVTPAAVQRASPRWIHGLATDAAMALCWVPFGLAALYWSANPSATRLLMSVVLLLSFTHQPLTLALVYGDREQFELRRRIFTWSPVVFAAAIYLALNVSLVLVAIVGGLWNAVHTLFQRYGITRIYGRKVGQTDGRLERALLLSWLVGALVWAAADSRTPGRIIEAGLHGHNRDALAILADLRPVAVVLVAPVVTVAAILTAAWVLSELSAGPAANPAKHLYVGSTAALFVLLVVHPIAGLIAYVGSHALEYFIIVYTNLRTRYQLSADDEALLGRAVRSRAGRPGVLVAYVGVLAGFVVVLEVLGNWMVYTTALFVLGGLHVFYDGFIWKLRRSRVASSFNLPVVAS